MKRSLLIVILILVSGGLWAQVQETSVPNDSVYIGNVPMEKQYEYVTDMDSPYQLPQTDFLKSENPRLVLTNPILPLKMTYKVQPYKPITSLASWNGGLLTGSNSIYYSPLTGYTATANLLLYESVGRWTFEGNAGLQKYGGMANTFTFDASAMYRIGNNVSATLFGMYQSPSFWSTYKTSSGYQYGGYFSLETNNHKWGVDLGARHVYNPWNGQHAVIPIVKPYYKIGKSKLGIDLGGLLNRNAANDGPPMFVPKPRPMVAVPRR